ncbi:hypothetical protein OsJ_29226 [Oryza sativa Japonica Group]|uniref:Uncharacterized protein n=1 Tax=Oryza sativa subsp. japonica TaxID=39947 RepID=A3BYG2_ORYSJ|nr:hypothetical protein OsJ_29226 [Oryza sativa Japonica Group]
MGVKLRIWSTQTRDGWIRDLRVQGVQIWITSLGRVFDDTRWCGQRTAYLADGSGAAEARTTGSGAPKLGMAGFATSEFRVFGSGSRGGEGIAGACSPHGRSTSTTRGGADGGPLTSRTDLAPLKLGPWDLEHPYSGWLDPRPPSSGCSDLEPPSSWLLGPLGGGWADADACRRPKMSGDGQRGLSMASGTGVVFVFGSMGIGENEEEQWRRATGNEGKKILGFRLPDGMAHQSALIFCES